MRLRLIIQRPELPPVKLLWDTDTAFHASDEKLVSTLVARVHDVFPLLFHDTGYRLESYVVEIDGFECLHFQPVEKVFKDGDEVVIRNRTPQEIEAAQRSGRYQKSRTGRLLLDGQPFGSHFVEAPRDRPPIRIPARKRQRVDDREPSTLYLSQEAYNNEEEHYEGEEGTNRGTSRATSRNGHSDQWPPAPIQAGRKRTMNDRAPPYPDRRNLRDPALVEAVRRAGGYERLFGRDEMGSAYPPEDEEDYEAGEEEEESGAQSFAADQVGVDGMPSTIGGPENAGSGTTQREKSEQESDEEEETTQSSPDKTSDSESSSSESDSDSDSSSSPSEAPVRKQSNQKKRFVSSSPESSSSSSSSSSSESESEPEPPKKPEQKRGTAPGTLPHQASKATRARNERKLASKKLWQLKDMGVFGDDINVGDMKKFLAMCGLNLHTPNEIVKKYAMYPHLRPPLPSTAENTQETTQPEQSQAAQDVTAQESVPQKFSKGTKRAYKKALALGTIPPDFTIYQFVTRKHNTQAESQPNAQQPPTPKDTNSPLPQSLNPGTYGKANKKWKTIRDAAHPTKTVYDPDGNLVEQTQLPAPPVASYEKEVPEQEQDPDAWRAKINLSAVECEQEGIVLPTPTFPFDQNKLNTRNQNKKRKKGRQNYTQEHVTLPEDENAYGQEEPTFDASMYDDPAPEPAPAEEEDDDPDFPPLPADLSSLPPLELPVKVGTVFAFKRYIMDPKTYCPVMQDYKQAKLLEMGNTGDANDISLICQIPKCDIVRREYDEEGNPIYGKFEMPGVEDELPEGQVELWWNDLIEAKVIKAGEGGLDENGEGAAEKEAGGKDGEAPDEGREGDRNGNDKENDDDNSPEAPGDNDEAAGERTGNNEGEGDNEKGGVQLQEEVVVEKEVVQETVQEMEVDMEANDGDDADRVAERTFLASTLESMQDAEKVTEHTAENMDIDAKVDGDQSTTVRAASAAPSELDSFIQSQIRQQTEAENRSSRENPPTKPSNLPSVREEEPASRLSSPHADNDSQKSKGSQVTFVDPVQSPLAYRPETPPPPPIYTNAEDEDEPTDHDEPETHASLPDHPATTPPPSFNESSYPTTPGYPKLPTIPPTPVDGAQPRSPLLRTPPPTFREVTTSFNTLPDEHEEEPPIRGSALPPTPQNLNPENFGKLNSVTTPRAQEEPNKTSTPTAPEPEQDDGEGDAKKEPPTATQKERENLEWETDSDDFPSLQSIILSQQVKQEQSTPVPEGLDQKEKGKGKGDKGFLPELPEFSPIKLDASQKGKGKEVTPQKGTKVKREKGTAEKRKRKKVGRESLVPGRGGRQVRMIDLTSSP